MAAEREVRQVQNIPGNTDSLDDLLRRYETLLSNVQKTVQPGGVNASAVPPAAPREAGAFMAELDTIIKNNQPESRPEVAAPLITTPPLSLEDIKRSFTPLPAGPVHEPAPQPQPVVQQPEPQPAPQQQPIMQQPVPQPIPQSELVSQQPEPPQQPDAAPLDSLEKVFGNHTAREKPPAINERQLKALSRKHLLMMVYDIQEELKRVREENEKMLTAYQAGLARKPGTGG